MSQYSDFLYNSSQMRRLHKGKKERCMNKQEALGDSFFGTPMSMRQPDKPAPADQDLDAIQADSEKQGLPQQDKLSRVAPRVRSKLHTPPDPTKPPLGFVSGRGFDVVFPFIKLPHLAPNL